MAEEIDDNGFYREDFSAESDWEIFNAQLCEIFQKWELVSSDWGRIFQPNELFQCKWKVKEELLNVRGNQVRVMYHRADISSLDNNKKEIAACTKNTAPMHEDLLSLSNTFGPPVLDDQGKNLHWLARFYGLRRFVVLNPHSEQNTFITKRSEFNFYFSAISVVAAELSTAVPIFVQIYDEKWNFFLGLGTTSFMRTNFDLVALEKPPQDFCYLSGLLPMFKEKLPKNCKESVIVSMRKTYTLDTVKLPAPFYVPFGITPKEDEEHSIISRSSFTALPHGFFSDSRTEMFAVFTWPKLTDNMVIDSAMQTQFLPAKAPNCAIYQDVHVSSYLTSCINYFHNLITAKTSLEAYVGRKFTESYSTLEIENPVEQLTKPHLSKIHAYRQYKLHGPMDEHTLNQMKCYIFPYLYKDVTLFPYESSVLSKDLHRIKTAIPDSLVHRISCLLATCYAHFGGESGLAQLWATFTRELRLLWELGISVPGVSDGNPDTKTCLFHQKLQMLNVCIERRRQREQNIKAPPQWSEMREFNDEKEDDDSYTEEVFFDCDEDDFHRSLSPVKEDGEAIKPEGRLKRLHDLKLLDSEEYLYVPITQAPVPKTEDQLQDDANLVLKLGPNSDRVTTMMCSTLQSDAEAFKAANLKARFEDFIRWYSPNDWEEYFDEDGIKYHKLSNRMKAEGNTWQKVWEQSQAIPVTRQKPLFDDTIEGYKVLNYLETLNLNEIYILTIVPLLHSTILKLENIFYNYHIMELFSASINEILDDLLNFSRDGEIVAGLPFSTTPNPASITNKIEQLEKKFYQYASFERLPQFSGIDNNSNIKKKFKEILKNHGYCTIIPKQCIEGEVVEEPTEVDERVMASFQQDMQEKLKSKDYVMRLGDGLSESLESEMDGGTSVKPVMPQFLRAIITGERLRLCGAFTENITFLN